MKEVIKRNKPHGATHWQAYCYYKLYMGMWFKWCDGYWNGGFIPDELSLVEL